MTVLFEFVDEYSQAAVGIGYRVQVLLVEAVEGDLERLVAAERKQDFAEGFFLFGFQVVGEFPENKLVMRAPLHHPVFEREILVGDDSVDAHRDEVGAHIGKVGITSVKEREVVPVLFQ